MTVDIINMITLGKEGILKAQILAVCISFLIFSITKEEVSFKMCVHKMQKVKGNSLKKLL